MYMFARITRAAEAIVSVVADLAVAQAQKNDNKPIKGGKPIIGEQVDVASRDLFWGPGGEAMKPDLSSVKFIEEEKGGYSTKYKIKDAAGRTWVAKTGNEAQSETAAVRL